MATFPTGTEADCTSRPGMSIPAPDVLATFQRTQHQQWVTLGSQGPDWSQRPSCQMNQLTQLPPGASASTCGPSAPASDFDAKGSCRNSKDPGWCYVPGQQSVVFSSGEPPSGVTVSPQCLEQSVGVIDAGGATSAGD
jgi:hypothetical protein